MALDIKKIIKQEVAKIMLEQHLLEAETPDHFGGGENIDVFGYQTENFDICKSAVMLFTKLKEKNLEGMAVDHAKKAAQHIDNVFGIEKDVVEEGSAAPEQMEEAVDSNMLFGYEIGALSMHIDEDLTRDTAFHKLHIMEIANRFQGNMSGNVTESINEAAAELNKLKDAIKMFQDKIKKQGRITNARDEEHLKNLIALYKKMGGKGIKEGKLNEAPMDRNFQKDWEKSGKALRNHLKHEMDKGKGVIGLTNLRTLDKLDQIVKLAIDVPKKMSQIVGEGKINEISAKAGLEDVILGRTSAIEGVKMSKDLAQGFIDWIIRSPYGRKYANQLKKARISAIIGPANAFGIERYLSPKAKKEFKDVYKKHGPKREVKEAAPGYMHDCASRVVHMEHGAGTCIPEQHNLVKEGKKWVVTEYDVKFDSGKIVKNVPVNELKIVSESHHGHKRRKKKKTNEMKVTNHKGENITKYVLQLLQGKINQKQFEKLTGLKKDKMKELKEKLVFYRDEKKRLRRFDTDKAANRRLSR